MKQKIISIVIGFAISSYVSAESIVPPSQSSNQWFSDAKSKVAEKTTLQRNKNKAKNIILFVGDGMGISTQTAARILEGQNNGNSGEENNLSFEKFPYSAQIKTYNTNQQTPDSAGTMTAIATGVKNKAGMLSVSENAIRGNCNSTKGQELTTFIELAEKKGMSTGIVSTARVTHATPAATYAKSAERNWESDNNLPEEAKQNGCIDIADQLINFEHGDGIDVVMGGGRRHFIPKQVTDIEGKSGKRKDKRNLINEWQVNNTNGVVVQTQGEFDSIDTDSTSKLLGLFNSSHMRYEADRSNDVSGEPSLTEMTSKAIDILSKNDNGYILVIESGRIDHGHHAGSAYNALTETIEYSNAVKAAVNKTNQEDTLIIVTADHSHVFTIAGYPTRGNPILGKVVGNDSFGDSKGTPSLDNDDLPYTTLGYTNGLGFADLGSETNADARYNLPINTGRKDLTQVNTTTTGYHQEALIPLSSETHAGEDIGLYAIGPGAQNIQGVVEQNVVFHLINKTAELNGKSY